MPNVGKKEPRCEFCTFGPEVLRVCGRLWCVGKATAHHKCMQYSSGLGQYKDEFSDFGNFDPKEVQKEIKRGKKLKCYLCKNRHGSATAGCALGVCPHSFHYLCAKQDPNRITQVKKLRLSQDGSELDEYVVFCKDAHKKIFEKQKKTDSFHYVESSDDDANPFATMALAPDKISGLLPSYKVAARKRPPSSPSSSEAGPSSTKRPRHSKHKKHKHKKKKKRKKSTDIDDSSLSETSSTDSESDETDDEDRKSYSSTSSHRSHKDRHHHHDRHSKDRHSRDRSHDRDRRSHDRERSHDHERRSHDHGRSQREERHKRSHDRDRKSKDRERKSHDRDERRERRSKSRDKDYTLIKEKSHKGEKHSRERSRSRSRSQESSSSHASNKKGSNKVVVEKDSKGGNKLSIIPSTSNASPPRDSGSYREGGPIIQGSDGTKPAYKYSSSKFAGTSQIDSGEAYVAVQDILASPDSPYKVRLNDNGRSADGSDRDSTSSPVSASASRVGNLKERVGALKDQLKKASSKNGTLLHEICRRISSSEEFMDEMPRSKPVKIKGKVTERKHRKPRSNDDDKVSEEEDDDEDEENNKGSGKESKSDGDDTTAGKDEVQSEKKEDKEAEIPQKDKTSDGKLNEAATVSGSNSTPVIKKNLSANQNLPSSSAVGNSIVAKSTTSTITSPTTNHSGPVPMMKAASPRRKQSPGRRIQFDPKAIVRQQAQNVVSKLWSELAASGSSQDGSQDGSKGGFPMQSVFTQDIKMSQSQSQSQRSPRPLPMQSVFTQSQVPVSSRGPVIQTQVPPHSQSAGLHRHPQVKPHKHANMAMQSVYTQDFSQHSTQEISSEEDSQADSGRLMQMQSVFTMEADTPDDSELEPGEVPRSIKMEPSQGPLPTIQHVTSLAASRQLNKLEKEEWFKQATSPNSSCSGLGHDGNRVNGVEEQQMLQLDDTQPPPDIIDPSDENIMTITPLAKSPPMNSQTLALDSAPIELDSQSQPLSPSLLSGPTNSQGMPRLNTSGDTPSSIETQQTPPMLEPYTQSLVDSVTPTTSTPVKSSPGRIIGHIKIKTEPMSSSSSPTQLSSQNTVLLASDGTQTYMKKDTSLPPPSLDKRPSSFGKEGESQGSMPSLDSESSQLQALSPMTLSPGTSSPTLFVGQKEVADLRETFNTYIKEASQKATSFTPKKTSDSNISPAKNSPQEQKSPTKPSVQHSMDKILSPRKLLSDGRPALATNQPIATGRSVVTTSPGNSQSPPQSRHSSMRQLQSSPMTDESEGPSRPAANTSDSVLCMFNLNDVNRKDKDSIYSKARQVFNVKRHQVLMKCVPSYRQTSGPDGDKVKFSGLLHMKEVVEGLKKKELEFVQKLAQDRAMKVHQDQHRDVPDSMFTSMPSIIEAILDEANMKYNTRIARMQVLTSAPNAVALMLYLNDDTDPGYKVRAMYNNIFIWHPTLSVDRGREPCNREREYQTLASWLDQQAGHANGSRVYLRPADDILLLDDPHNVAYRLRKHVQQDSASIENSTARKVAFIGPVPQDIMPSMSPYLRKCIPKLVEELMDEDCRILLCVISIDKGIGGIKDVCAPLPGFDMNIITAFGPMEFSPSCFILKIARRISSNNSNSSNGSVNGKELPAKDKENVSGSEK